MSAPWDSEVHMAMSWVDLFWKRGGLRWSLDYETGLLTASLAVFLLQVFPSWMPYSGWRVRP